MSKQNASFEELIDKTINEELTPDGNLLPPWQRYPDIPRYSIGWRMGYGESYIKAWIKWSVEFTQEQMLAYFHKYKPIPPAWMDWVAAELGHDDAYHDVFKGGGDFNGIHWLEEQGLASFKDFSVWFEEEQKNL
jgi:hypothetical protein